ncbi:DUF2922 domain-containing protein [Levilactobacillus suantsaii]|uniref:DUF2922 domain-containing protein n=1 Tax=Levilactobacillus suantsaii TaxID=2292255 RepID=A0A4V1LF74_9LACO|nr:DUF2922 domain-containing protein [Levilactobacillus suantsaii]QMU08348.1 DUF2922 domain-containing protein [Levilactobacillus suantsaii]RXI77236.1 DUF2922 domain-containing protein [Levilactobacillus suantsaii]
MKSLELTFKGADHRIKNLRLKYVSADLTAENALAIMAKMADTKLFAKEDVALYATPVSAQVIETTKTPLPAATA